MRCECVCWHAGVGELPGACSGAGEARTESSCHQCDLPAGQRHLLCPAREQEAGEEKKEEVQDWLNVQEKTESQDFPEKRDHSLDPQWTDIISHHIHAVQL